MKCAVLNIGDEVLIGDTINTNLSLIAKMGREYDISVEEQITIKDIEREIIKNTRYLINKYDLLVTTGGLGPTVDDLTTESIALALNRDLILDQRTLDKLEHYFEIQDKEMSDNNKKQAYFPRGAKIIDNDYGTASGFYVEKDGKYVVVLPGPPREAENIFAKFLEVLPREQKLLVKIINTYSIGESDLEARLRQLDISPNISSNTYFGKGNVDIKLVAHNEYEDELNHTIDTICKEFKNNVFAIDSPSIAYTLVEKLRTKNKKVAFAESCTGGKISSLITEIPGASDCLLASLVTYSQEAKIKELGVKRDSLDKYSAVSKEVAKEMLLGLMERYKADYYGITTGYASAPEDESLRGLVYIGIYDRLKDQMEIEEIHYAGSRIQIIERASYNVLNKIYRKVEDV